MTSQYQPIRRFESKPTDADMESMSDRPGGCLTWCAAAALLIVLILGIGSVFYSFFGVGGYGTLLVGAALVGLSAAGLRQLGGGGPFNDGSLNDPRAWIVLGFYVALGVVILATK
jgi:hypothetical protein